MEPELLESIGLTTGESKVYLALLKLGNTTTGPLAKESGVSASKVYKILDRLMSKGLAGYITQSKTKHFNAVEPRRILDYLDREEEKLQEKKEKVESLIPELELERTLSKEANATLFQGFKAVTNVITSSLDEMKKGETYYVMGATYGDTQGLRPFFYKHHQKRTTKGINVKMLANHETKGNLETTTSTHSIIKYLPKQFISNMIFYFYHDKTLIIFLTKHPTAFMIQSKEAVKNFKAHFDALWKIAQS